MTREKILIAVLVILLLRNMFGCALLAEKPERINAKDKNGLTSLHHAAASGYKDVAELLITKGADVNAKDKIGYTPLHYSASFGHKDVAELLITKGVDVNAKAKNGLTPLQVAISSISLISQKDIAELLRRHGGK
jgi:ankyrin repeat protein